MKLYRYLSEKELQHIMTNEIDKIGSFYDSNEYKDINTHKYKKGVKYLHFYFDKKEISKVRSLALQGRSVCYICEFEIPFYKIFNHIGIGKYYGNGYNGTNDKVYEVALPAHKMKREYLTSHEKDTPSGPINLGPRIKFNKALFVDDDLLGNIQTNEDERCL